jgi:hypothetical protein
VQLLGQHDLGFGSRDFRLAAVTARSPLRCQAGFRAFLNKPTFELASAEKMLKINSPEAQVVSIAPS